MKITKMLKKVLMAGITAAMAFSLVTVTAGAEETSTYDGPEYSLQLGHVGAAGSIEETLSNRFKELVEEKSDGKITIEIFGNSQLGGLTDLVDAVRYGTTDIAFFAMGDAESYFPKGAVMRLPYLFSGFDHLEAFLQSEDYATLLDEFSEATGIRALAPYHAGFRMILCNVEIHTADDMEGLSMRVPDSPSYVKTFTALGCNTVSISAADVYQALQTGLVEATEAAPVFMKSMNYHEVTKYCIKTNHIYADNNININQDLYDSMDPAAAQILEDAAWESCREAWSIVSEQTDETLEEFEAAGLTLIDPDLESFKTVMSGIWGELYTDNVEGGAELVEKIQSYDE